jgi:hypothetical protein
MYIEHFFHFGFVIPGSTNTWEQTIVAAPPDKMLPLEVLRYNLYLYVQEFRSYGLSAIAVVRSPSKSRFTTTSYCFARRYSVSSTSNFFPDCATDPIRVADCFPDIAIVFVCNLAI